MPLVLKDRVRETSITVGTGTLTLDGAVAGFQSFSVIGNANTTYYAIVDVNAGSWEVGLGTYTASGTTLSRDVVLESSAGGVRVNFTSSIKDVFCTYPAEQAVTLDDVQTLTNKTLTGTGNLSFSGSGRRITGDMSDLSQVNRLSFQTSVANANTVPFILPNGTGDIAGIALSNSPDPSNCSTGQLAAVGSTDIRLISSTIGTGTQLPLTIYTSNLERLRVTPNGNVGIGTTSPTAKLVVANSGDFAQIQSTNGIVTQRVGYAAFNTAFSGSQTNHSYVLLTNDQERVRIDINGRFLVGRNSAYSDGSLGTPLVNITSLVGDRAGLAMIGNSTNTVTQIGFVNTNGTVGSIQTTGSTTSYNTASDYRLKNTVESMTGALAKVAALKPVTYKWNADGSDGQGFIAHELQAVINGCVTGEKDATREQEYEVTPAAAATYDDDGQELTPGVPAEMAVRTVPSYQGIDTSFLVATLTAAIQEQQVLISNLTDRIIALEAAP